MNLRLPGRLILVIFLTVLSLALALAVAAAQANTYTETFSGPLNPRIWETYSSGEGVTINVTDGHLVITMPAHAAGTGTYSAGIRTKFNTGTAWQSQVDYKLVTWPEWYDWTLQVGLWGSGENLMQAIRTQRWDYGWHEIVSVNFHGNQYQKYVDGNIEGSLRLWRNSGGGVGGDYNIGSGWQAIGSFGYNPGDGPFVLQVVTGPGAGAVEVHFDNFVITGVNVPKFGAGMAAVDLLLLD